jgi:hypothetical protein
MRLRPAHLTIVGVMLIVGTFGVGCNLDSRAYPQYLLEDMFLAGLAFIAAGAAFFVYRQVMGGAKQIMKSETGETEIVRKPFPLDRRRSRRHYLLRDRMPARDRIHRPFPVQRR